MLLSSLLWIYKFQRLHDFDLQTRSRAALQERLTKAVKSNANGVLLLSGSHPAHRLSVYLGQVSSLLL